MTDNKGSYRKIKDGMGINEVNEILINQCSYDLYNFAVSLAVVLNDSPIFGFWNIWEIKKAKIPGIEEVKEEIERLSKIRSKILRLTKGLKRHLRKLPDWHQIKKETMDETLRKQLLNEEFTNLPDADEITRKVYKIEDTLNIIGKEIDFLQNNMWRPFRKGTGKAVEPSIIICAFWSLVIRKNKNADMKNIENLISWFANKLQDTEYGSKLNYRFINPTIYRFKTENKEKLDEDRASFFPRVNEDNSEEAKLPRTLRVKFANASPEIAVYNSLCIGKQSPLIIFPDGTTFPDSD